jgi:hypothetical protein
MYGADETGLFYYDMLDGSRNSLWLKESSGSCNCVVLFKLVRN